MDLQEMLRNDQWKFQNIIYSMAAIMQKQQAVSL